MHYGKDNGSYQGFYSFFTRPAHREPMRQSCSSNLLSCMTPTFNWAIGMACWHSSLTTYYNHLPLTRTHNPILWLGNYCVCFHIVVSTMLIVLSTDDSYCWFSKGSTCAICTFSNIVYLSVQSTLKRQTCITSCFNVRVQPIHPFYFFTVNLANELVEVVKHRKILDSSGRRYSQMYCDGFLDMSFSPEWLQL